MGSKPFVIQCLLLVLTTGVHADSGVVRVSGIDGPWRLTVFSEPTPFRAGLVDLSVLVQDANTDEAILDATVSMMLEHGEGKADSLLVEATREAATNRLLYSAKFQLPEPGPWHVAASAMGDNQVAQVSFQLEAGQPIPPILDMWPWFALPVIAILLIAMNQWLQRRKRRGQQERAA